MLKKKEGFLFVRKTANNVFCCLKEVDGNILLSSSGGRLEKGRNRTTKIVGEHLGFKFAQKVKFLGFTEVNLIYIGLLKLNGEGFFRGLKRGGLTFNRIKFILKKKHGFMRRRKARRK